MNMTIDVDARELKAAFNRAPRIVGAKVQDWVETTAAKAERQAKAEVPILKGQLKSSIHMSIGRLNALVRPNTRYMYWVHDGAKSPFAPRKLKNSSYRGNPFMTRTFNKVQPDAERAGQKLLNDIVKAI